MNFSIHIDVETAQKLDHLVKETRKPRNALINQALRLFLNQREKSEWPSEVKKLAGAFPSLSSFEDLRKDLAPLREDPFE